MIYEGAEARILEIEAPSDLRCYIELYGKWRTSRLATQMIHAGITIFVEVLTDMKQPETYRIYFKKDARKIVQKILEGNY